MLRVTPIYAGLLGLLLVGLSIRVIQGRVRFRVGLGDGGNHDLTRRIRAQANCAEYAPFGVLLLAIAELQGAGTLWLHGFGAILLIGRLAHATGLSGSGGESPLRSVGMALTFAALIGLSLLCLGRAFGAI
ncbi:MAG: hypothetical protein GC186_09050 [Rhodobacteraceae bacterium]|nr:hypothetical protein [Paracoccaceae bacterium]